MKKIFFLTLLILLILPSISAINLDIEKISSEEVLIIGLNKPAVFNLRITNRGERDNFMFYSFFGSDIYPKGTVFIGQGQTEDVELGIYPREDLTYRGFMTFNYFIKSSTGEQKESLTVKIIDLEDALEVSSEDIYPTSSSVKIYLKNLVNFNFGKIHVKFSSPFFEEEKDFVLDPKEREEFEILLNRENFKELKAGFYTLKAEITIDGKKVNLEGIIKFQEKDIITTTEKKFGFGITTNAIKKINEGNLISTSETLVKKNIISRLFTGFNVQPDFVERKGFNVYYSWVKEIKPGETLEIVIRTNWFFPLLAIFFIIAIVILVKKFTGTNLILRKRVSFVKAKGGEFALKVSIFVTARRYVERVAIVDRLPPLVKLHERFGVEHPKRINEKERKIEWSFEKLEAGESRVISYIIYSKIGVVGKFALPPATAIYEREGVIKETESNRAFFLTEQKQRD